MPLTPAEVHNVAFKKPPIGKRGYDEEEVDAFLDIVEVELSRLIEENNDLRGHPASGNGAGAPEAARLDTGVDMSKGSSADDGRLSAAIEALTASNEENQRLQSHLAELEHTLSQSSDSAQQQVVQLQQQLAQNEQELADSRRLLEQAQQAIAEAQQAAQRASVAEPDDTGGASMAVGTQAVQVLVLAQQTADQHLAMSKATADRLVAEAQASSEATLSSARQQAEQQLGEAESRARQLDEESTSRAARTVQDAEQRAATITAQFEQRKESLERSVEELRIFEREYRSRLRSYLESQMRDLDASTSAEPAPDEDLAEAPQG